MPVTALTDRYRDRFALSPAEAAHALGVTRKHIYTLMSRGDLRSTLIGASRRIPVTEVERLAGIEGGPDDTAA
jgi:excisionase family DNA binding protein